MGNENSNEENSEKRGNSEVLQEEEIFSLEDLSDISLETKPLYFWVDPHVDSPENIKCQEYLKLSEVFLLKVFKSVGDLEKEIQNLEIGVQVRVICPTALETYDFVRMSEN